MKKQKQSAYLMIVAIALFFMGGCVPMMFGNEEKYEKGEPSNNGYYYELSKYRNDKLAHSENEWVLKTVRAEYKAGTLRPLSTKAVIPKVQYKFIIENRNSRRPRTAQIYQILKPSTEDRSKWFKDGIFVGKLVRLVKSTQVPKKSKMVVSLNMGYYIVRFADHKGRHIIDVALTLVPQVDFFITDQMVLSTGANPEDIKNYTFVN